MEKRDVLFLGLMALVLLALVSILRPEQVSSAPSGYSSTESLNFIRPGYLYSTQQVAAGAASAATTELAQDELVRIECTVDVRYDQGGATVAAAATESLLQQGNVLWLKTHQGYTYLAFIRGGGVNGSCTVSVFR